MINSILNELIISLPSATFILEILALIIAVYFKKFNILAITSLLICTKVLYLFSSAYQVNVFVSLFLPLIFSILLTLKKDYDNLKSFLPTFLVIFSYLFLGIFLSQSTNFNVSITNKFLNQSLAISDIFIIFFIIFLAYLFILKFFKKLENFYIFAYFGALFEFLFFNLFEKADLSYFEFSSFIFLIAIAKEGYNLAFIDAKTKVFNNKAYERAKLKNSDILCVLSIDFAKNDNETKEFLLIELAKILKTHFDKIYKIDNKFIIIIKNDKMNSCVEKLDNIKKLAEKSIFEKNNIKTTVNVGISVVQNDKSAALNAAYDKLNEAKNKKVE